MTIRRGDVVLLDWPLSRGGTKIRPALVIQNDRDNSRLTNTIVAMITSVTRRAAEPTQFLISVSSSEGMQTGLHHDCVVNLLNLFTLEQSKIIRVIGKLTGYLATQADDCLRVALSLP